jgi:hypothetical protein
MTHRLLSLIPASRSGRVRLTFEVTILVVLVATASVRLIDVHSVLSQVPTQDCELEYLTVQIGLDNYKAKNHLSTVPAAVGTHDMTKPIMLYQPAAYPPDTNYVLNRQTQWSYSWDSSGRVDAIGQSPGGPTVPAGCVIPG